MDKGAVIRTDKSPPTSDHADTRDTRDTSSNKYGKKARIGGVAKKRKYDTIDEGGDKDEAIREEAAEEEA